MKAFQKIYGEWQEPLHLTIIMSGRSLDPLEERRTLGHLIYRSASVMIRSTELAMAQHSSMKSGRSVPDSVGVKEATGMTRSHLSHGCPFVV